MALRRLEYSREGRPPKALYRLIRGPEGPDLDAFVSSTHVGAWSLAFSQPRTSRSTPAALRLCATAGLSRIWSMRSPALRPQAFRK
jgi:hypothetical protein